MIFEVLSNIILGILGGIISSIIVSRVFLIHGDYQNQLRFFDQLLHKLGYIAGVLAVVRKVFEVSCDEEIKMQREMKERGYKSEAEYYQAHNDKDWISKSALLKKFLSEVKKIAQSIKDELFALHIEYPQLAKIRDIISSHVNTILDLNEFTFSDINKLDQESNAIADDYGKIKSMTAKQIIKLIVTDKVMIILASRKKGIITRIMHNVAVPELTESLSKKKSGTPISTAAPKQMSCRLVNPNSTFVFTFVRSFGTVT